MLKSTITALALGAAFGAAALATDIAVPVALAQVTPSANGPAVDADEARRRVLEEWGAGIFIVILGTGWVIVKVFLPRKRQHNALRIATADINSNAANLRVKRLQTVQPDHYGTVLLDKWEQEKEYYIDTRILPALRAKGLDGVFAAVAPTIRLMIEKAAQRSIPSPSDTEPRFISNPEVFDPRMN